MLHLPCEQTAALFYRFDLAAKGALTWDEFQRVLMHLERMDESIAAYKKAVRIAPGRAAIRAGLGRAQLKAGEYKAAEHNLRKARKMNPNDASTDKLIRERFE